jgi:glycosyltransferase involved in cell wall biosynthesis
MRILIATDAWAPQINGVVRVFETTVAHLEAQGHVVEVIGPDRFATTFPAPGYPEVRLAMTVGRALPEMIDAFRPDAIHIPVEGPIGLAARHYCRKRRLPFTTSFHTRFGDYFAMRLGFGTAPAYAAQRWFHNAGDGFMVQTATLEKQLSARGFRNIRSWGRAVDTLAFRPYREDPGFDADFLGLPRPIFMYVGRVSPEKNLPAFLGLDLPGSKVVVGDGPAAAHLAARFPDVHFLGYRHGEDLARHFSAADVFVFPSRFETFGLVVLEALACGTPVAAFPVQGPADIIGDTPHGVLSEDLHAGALSALSIDRAGCRRFAESFSWAACTAAFAANLVRIPA